MRIQYGCGIQIEYEYINIFLVALVINLTNRYNYDTRHQVLINGTVLKLRHSKWRKIQHGTFVFERVKFVNVEIF